MAKDNRKKNTATTAKKRKFKLNGKRLTWISIAVCAVLLVVFGIVAVNAIKNGGPKKDGSESDVNKIDTTPIKLQSSVSYYVVGLLGPEETSPTTSLFLLCHDKKAKTINVLEVPGATYLGDSDLWIEKKAGLVWGNPAPLDWCDTCGRRLYKAELADHEGQEHTITQKIGSASYNLISIFNEQYSLPIDEYFMIPQESFIKLVDLLGGLDVKLDKAMTLNEIKFGAGVRTLDGKGAVEYISMGGDTVKADLSRVLRQRQIFLALFQRLCAQTDTQLQEDSIIPVMKGSTPFRTRATTDDILAILQSWREVPTNNIKAMTAPGKATTLEGVSYYSLYRAQLIDVLNKHFNPYGAKITESDVQVTELVTGSNADIQLQTMDKIAVKQNMIKPPKEE